MYILITVIGIDVVLIIYIMVKLVARRVRLHFEKKRIETLLRHDIDGKFRKQLEELREGVAKSLEM